jgi:predicted component of type VI protein secretion system
MITKLIVATGKSAGRSIAVKKNTLLIGRAEECDIRPLSEDVSRRHAAVHVGPADVWVEDLGSRNGTFVNGERIAGKTKVSSGDLIRVGALELTVSCSEPAPKEEGEDDVSKWLMADDAPAGMFDTTRSLRATTPMPGAGGIDPSAQTVAPDHDSASIHAVGDPGADVHGSTISGISGHAATPAGGSTTSKGSGSATTVGQGDAARGDSSVAIEALKESNAKPGSLPATSRKGTVNSRDAAAEALKKFFGNR